MRLRELTLAELRVELVLEKDVKNLPKEIQVGRWVWAVDENIVKIGNDALS